MTGWYAEISTSVTAPRMDATALLKPPVVGSVSPFIIAPPRMSSAAAMKTPAVGFSTTITSPRMSATGVMAVPTISNFVNASITAPRMSATGALAVPSVDVSGTITPARMAATAALAVPTVSTVTGASYSDTFNRSNSSTLGGSWITDPSFGTSLTIASNAAVRDSSGSGANFYASAMLTGNNQITVVMKGSPTAGDFVYIAARCDTTDGDTVSKSVTLVMAQGSKWTLYRANSDTGILTTGNESWADGDTILFSCIGSTLTVKRNGATVLTTGGATDLAAGYVELVTTGSGAGIGFDSFTAQDI